MSASPTFSQIKALVASIKEKNPRAVVVGLRSSGRWTGESERRDGSDLYEIHQCNSPLAILMALREPMPEGATRVLITPLDEGELGDDILLRLAKRRLFQIDSWHIVRSLFQARAVDPGLSRMGWIADMLLDRNPPGGYPAARGGFLDAETVWPILLRQEVGLPAESLDLSALLKWTLDASATGRFRTAPATFREGASEWLVAQVGEVAAAILGCVSELERPDAVPLGIAAGVVFHPDVAGKLERAAGKLEQGYLGGKTLESSLMQRWVSAACEVARALRHNGSRDYRPVLERADDILREVQAEGFAYQSDLSLLGFDQRLTRFGQRLTEMLTEQSWEQMDGLKAAHRAVRDHDQAKRETRQAERVEMALRLARWLGDHKRRGDALPSSLSEAAALQLSDGGFVDWARLSLRAGDPVRELSGAYARLFDLVTTIREQQSQAFARLLADWTTAGSPAQEVLPVERILAEIVASLAEKAPILVIVIDGMSAAVCCELLADVVRHDWTALAEPGRVFNRPGIAAIPSMTEFSRTSLLCGCLRQGVASDEAAGFGEHAALSKRCRSGFPPILFHKAALQERDDAELATNVRKEIASSHRKIVGVVINAVDDNLLKGEQIDTRWSRDAIRVMPSLLYEARQARRLVILLSDHGHILDCQTEGRSGDGPDRWRSATDVAGAGELSVQGTRVLVPGHRLVATWSERLRYSSKKNGYHGGLTAQEMVIPIVVLASGDDFPSDWQELPVESPAWWDEPVPVPAQPEQKAPTLKPVRVKKPGMLFDLDHEEEPEVPVPTHEPVTEWIKRLVASPVFAEQKQIAGRAVPADEFFVRVLVALDQRGGKMTSAALSRTLELAGFRLSGALAKMQRVLNIDGYAVLSRDDASDTVELNRELLLKQFDLV